MGYIDADYARDFDDRRSTTGYVFTLGRGPVCWKSIVQSLVALSTTKSEYMAVAEVAKEALWLAGLVIGVNCISIYSMFLRCLCNLNARFTPLCVNITLTPHLCEFCRD